MSGAVVRKIPTLMSAPVPKPRAATASNTFAKTRHVPCSPHWALALCSGGFSAGKSFTARKMAETPAPNRTTQTTQPNEGLFEHARALLAALSEYLHARLKLAGIETKEALVHYIII